MKLALLATAATLLALPAFAQAPPKPPTPLEKAIADLNQSYSGLNGNINALGITANDIRDHQIAAVQAAIGAVLAAKTQEDADKLAAQKAADDAALAAAKRAASDQHKTDTDKLAALQRRVDDQARQLLHVSQLEPPMCINGPMSPKQLRELPHSLPPGTSVTPATSEPPLQHPETVRHR